MQNEKAQINNRFVFQKCPDNFTFQLLSFCSNLPPRETCHFLTKQPNF